MKRLVTCIDKGLAQVKTSLGKVARDVAHLRIIYSTLDPDTGPTSERRDDFDEMVSMLRATSSPIHATMAAMMERWAPGLFAGDDDRSWENDASAGNDEAPTETPRTSSSEDPQPSLPADNLELERWFRHPKGHERRIHGHAHAGVRIVHEGPTLLPTLDAHLRHPEPFTAEELIPSLHATAPLCQRDTESRRKIMRRARSRKYRPLLLADLERRYSLILGS